VIRAHQPGSEPIDIPETIPNPVVVPKPTPTPTERSQGASSDPGEGSLGRRLKVLSVGDGEFEYRIKSMNKPHERVVRFHLSPNFGTRATPIDVNILLALLTSV
jgi:hypothetical protein